MIYDIDAKCPGLFVMINNFEFEHLSNRDSAENDTADLKNLFESMKYDIYDPSLASSTVPKLPSTTENLTFKQMDDVLDDVGRNKGNHSSLILVVSSHGNDGIVCGTDHKKDSALELKINKIVKKFMNKNWAGKPKIIIFQACQGDVVDLGFEIEEEVNQGWSNKIKLVRKLV